jgi:hypothetical protein
MAGVPGSDGVEVPPLPVELAELVAELEAEPDPVEVACPHATSVSAQASATQQARSRRTATEQTILQPLPGVDFKFARAAETLYRVVLTDAAQPRYRQLRYLEIMQAV